MTEPLLKAYHKKEKKGYSLPSLKIPEKNKSELIDKKYIRHLNIPSTAHTTILILHTV